MLSIIVMNQLLSLIFKVVSAPWPISPNRSEFVSSASSFEQLPDDVLLTIVSYIPDFPRLSEVSPRLRKFYENHRKGLIRERLDGFDPGENYKLVGSWIQKNHENSRNYEIIEKRINFIFRKNSRSKCQLKYEYQIELFTLHAIKHLDPSEIVLLMKHTAFYNGILKVWLKENIFEVFKTFYPCYMRFHKWKDYFEYYDYHIIHDIILISIIQSIPIEDFKKVLDAAKHLTKEWSGGRYLDIYCYTIIGLIETHEQLTLFETLLVFMHRRFDSDYLMAFTLLLDPQNWPPSGTWPQVFFHPGVQSGADWSCNVYEMYLIKQTLKLADRWRRYEISFDISAHMPTLKPTPSDDYSCVIQ